MAKKGFLATLFGGVGKRSGGSRASKGRSTSSSSKARSAASKRTSSASKRTSSASKTTSQTKRQRKTPSKTSTTKNKKGLMARFFDWLSGLFSKKKKSDIGKIYWTNDGYFTQHENPKKTKPRPVAVVDQRKSDGALAVAKLHKKDGKSGKDCIDGLVIKASEHTSLKDDSIVERRVIIGTRKSGVKSESDKNHRPIFARELTPTNDKLTKAEMEAVLGGVQNDTPKHRATHEQTMRKWHDGFKKGK